MHIASSLLAILLASIGCVSSANGASQYAPKQPPLTTPWTDEVGTNPWPEYPRPQLQRSEWKNLNGIWRYENATSLQSVQQPPFGKHLSQEVLVPSCLESALSGIQGQYMLNSWFSTSFTVPKSWEKQRVLLNFGAVDYEATVFINGRKAGFHRGGYFHFTVDGTSHVSFDRENELLVFVHDPTDNGDSVIPIGKQTLHPSHIFYTPCSGIWQSVWVESAPANHITQLDIDANMHGEVSATVHSSQKSGTPVEVAVHERNSGEVVAYHQARSPHLYNVTVRMGADHVRSYTGFRSISKGMVDGVVRPLVNGEFQFLFGPLDQGYWPDGLYTAPNREAMVYDLKVLKKLGFNMVRKHVKIEPALFYQACDEMGFLVIQDMPALRQKAPNAKQQAEFSRQLELMVKQLKNYPSIMTWVIYNEGWGQLIDGYPEFGLTKHVKEIDPTRLVDSTSGWYDHGAGDFSDNHHYANPQCGTPFYSLDSSPYDPSRIGFQGEFGGLGSNVSINHLWNVQEAIDTIDQTYEIDESLAAWNYRSHILLGELEDQIRRFACSGGVWTQTTDVEGEVNGLLTYDRRLLRVDEMQWRADIMKLYDAGAARSHTYMPAF
ncbi:Hydrolase [Aspergillus sclerotialis]|uniref:Hydrolase n=1 Tax=Aspergillus sclerotialis TaxID=2070753 RepID=A0A3A2Z4W7_9EURO|nr:Hydrolase [Aspergillus sclerotialis]